MGRLAHCGRPIVRKPESCHYRTTTQSVMKSFALPIPLTALAALASLPFSGAAAGLLMLTAALGAIISIDYPRRYRSLPVPRRARRSHRTFCAPPLCNEPHRLAA